MKANSDWLRLGPMRMEEVWHDPQVVKFQNILYDSECDYISGILAPHLRPWHSKRNETKSDYRRMKK